MVSVLELFEGRLTYNDIMTMDIPVVKELVSAKEKLLEEREKARKQLEANSTSK